MAEHTHSSISVVPEIVKVVAVAFIAAVLVAAALFLYLSQDLPETESQNFKVSAAGLKFAFGSGHLEQEVLKVNGFDDGYALLTSGPVNIQADQLPVLQYLWAPSGKAGDLAYFWRQQGSTAQVRRTEVTATGNRLLDLSGEPDWKGEIVEVGFLVAGDTQHPVTFGQLILRQDDLSTRLKMVWQDWTTYELRSQQSINFLQGGAHSQKVALPPVVLAWLLITLILLRLLSGKHSNVRAGLTSLNLAVVLFLSAWMLLDIRWTVNSFRSASALAENVFGNGSEVDPDLRSGNDLDGPLFKYIQRLKSDIIEPGAGENINRILVVGDGTAIDYYLLRAKYHLLPDSAHVAGHFEKTLSPESLNYVIYFGRPDGIAAIPGWNAQWREALVEIDRSKWGVVYQVRARRP